MANASAWFIARDRACLAMGIALGMPIYTADRSWRHSHTSHPLASLNAPYRVIIFKVKKAGIRFHLGGPAPQGRER